jgi:regulator of cell morphogenesis and NO signaling
MMLKFDREQQSEEQSQWGNAKLALLADHIVGTHHVYLKSEMPRIEQLMTKVASVHGANHPALKDVLAVYTALSVDVEKHLANEETSVFPAMKREEAGTATQSDLDLIHQGLTELEAEHQVVGKALAEMRSLTDGYILPPDGCPSYHALMHNLVKFETDFHIHVHKENNILFPKVKSQLNH